MLMRAAHLVRVRVRDRVGVRVKVRVRVRVRNSVVHLRLDVGAEEEADLSRHEAGARG